MATMAEQIANATSNNELSSLLASDKFGIYPASSYLTIDGATDDYTALNNLINTTINGADAEIWFKDGTSIIGTSITIPSNVKLKFLEGGMLKPSSGVVITGSNSKIEAGLTQIFDLTASGSTGVAGTWDCINVCPQWFGSVGDGVTDDTATFTYAAKVAVAISKTLYVPEGTYLLDDVDLSSTASMRDISIVCDDKTFFTGADNTKDLFDIGGQRRMNFIGGQFLKANRCFYTDNTLAPAYCRFERLRFKPQAASDIKKGFEMETSVGNTFYECQFGWDNTADGIETGVDMTSTSAGETNVNRFISCTFINFKDYGYRQRGSAYRKASNTFVGCWFEDSNGIALYAGQNTFNISIIGCYFENVGSATTPNTIEVDQATNVSFRECFFANPATDMEEWISCTNSNIVANNCTVFVSSVNSEKFIKFGTITSNQRLSDIYMIDSDSAGDYKTLLFSNDTAANEYLVQWDITRNSSTTTGDDLSKIYIPQVISNSRIKQSTENGGAKLFSDDVALTADLTWYDVADITIGGSGSTSFRAIAQYNGTHQGVGNAARWLDVWIDRTGGTVTVTGITNTALVGGIELQFVADSTNAKLQARRSGGSATTVACMVETVQADSTLDDVRVSISNS